MNVSVDKKKTGLMIGVMSLIYLLFLVLSIKCISMRSYMIATIVFISIAFIYFYIKILREISTRILINSDGIFYKRQGKEIYVTWPNIQRLEYSGTKYFPFSENMLIYAGTDIIYIDYTISNYLEVWKEIVSLLDSTVEHPIIDMNLKLRINQT